MIYTTYNPQTGQIYSTITSTDHVIPESTDQLGVIPGAYSGRDYRIVNGEPQQLPEDPSNEYSKYNFDYVNGTWKLNQDLTAFLSRHHRNRLLQAVDRINPIWYGSLTSQQQSELSQYRQCLLDVPQQPGWPESVTWPRVPTWL